MVKSGSCKSAPRQGPSQGLRLRSECLLDDRQCFIEKVLWHGQWWQETQYVAIGASGQHDNTFGVASLCHLAGGLGIGFERPWLAELDSDHCAATTDVGDHWVLNRHRLKARNHDRLYGPCGTDEIEFFHRFDCRQQAGVQLVKKSVASNKEVDMSFLIEIIIEFEFNKCEKPFEKNVICCFRTLL